jgi:shikimate kinase
VYAGAGARVPSMNNRRIVIVGFMGSGKTTVAQALARQLDCRMTDLDSFIAEREGRSPAEIIAHDGEAAFREVEAQALRDVLENNEDRVIALGGGAWTIEINRALIAEHDCLSVWLDAPFELCWERIRSNSKTIRPLAPNRESALRLYESRRTSYLLAQLHIGVSAQKDIGEVISEITRKAS